MVRILFVILAFDVYLIVFSAIQTILTGAFMSYLVCDKCGGYYELQLDESPEDFADKCDCGGNLKCIKDLNDLEGLQNLYPSTNKFEEFLKKEENQYLIDGLNRF